MCTLTSEYACLWFCGCICVRISLKMVKHSVSLILWQKIPQTIFIEKRDKFQNPPGSYLQVYMCASVCVCVRTHLYVRVPVGMCTSTLTYMCPRVYVYFCVYMCACVCTSAFICVCLCVYLCTCAFMLFVCAYVRMRLYMYARIHV